MATKLGLFSLSFLILSSVILCALALYWLLTISAKDTFNFGNYQHFFFVNVFIITCLISGIAWQIYSLIRQLHKKTLGSKLTLKMVSSLVLMAIIPGIVYISSVNFLLHSIDSWFNIKVETALKDGIYLGQNAIDLLLNDIKSKGEHIALSLSLKEDDNLLAQLHELREKGNIEKAIVLTAEGKIKAFSNIDATDYQLDIPSQSQFSRAKYSTYAFIDVMPNKGMYLRVIIPLHYKKLDEESSYLQLMQSVPKQIAGTAETVQKAYQNYQQLLISRKAIKEIFTLMWTLILTMVMLVAISVAFIISRKISTPLIALTEGTQALAQGNYEKILPVHSTDELSMLVNSFNNMTQKLGSATRIAEQNQKKLEIARAYLATILSHLGSGVITLDETKCLRTFNPMASQIIGFSLDELVDQPLNFWSQRFLSLDSFVKIIEEYIEKKADDWQTQFTLTSLQGERILLLRGSILNHQNEQGYVLVFDDITKLIQVQREATWGEIARRLAHEIKNPLTPIQLSAERLHYKLANKLGIEDNQLLQKLTQTIVAQVSAMKNMVNEFNEYARPKSPQFFPVDLNMLIQEILTLYETSEKSKIEWQIELLPNPLVIQGNATRLRQVFHNIIKNSQEALLQQGGKIFIKSGAVKEEVYCLIKDNGGGFPDNFLTNGLQPYTTTKTFGTGLGLAIVKRIIEEHHGTLILRNTSDLGKIGAEVHILFKQKV